MSLYQLQKFLFDMNRDRSAQQQFHADLPALLARYDLSKEERQALIDRDIGLIYVLGANGQLLMHYAAFLGIPWADYLDAMRKGIAIHGPVRAGVYTMTTQLHERVANI